MLFKNSQRGKTKETTFFALLFLSLAITFFATGISAQSEFSPNKFSSEIVEKLPLDNVVQHIRPGRQSGTAGDKENKPGTSQHLIIFSGAGWRNVWSVNSTTLKAALLKDIAIQLLRQYAFNTTITVDSLNVKNNMEALVTVTQAVLPGVYDNESLHLWPPDEANSMIMQSPFNSTMGLYTAADPARLVSVHVPGAGNKFNTFGSLFVFLIVLGIIALASMVLGLFLAILWMCCCGSKQNEDKYYAN